MIIYGRPNLQLNDKFRGKQGKLVLLNYSSWPLCNGAFRFRADGHGGVGQW